MTMITPAYAAAFQDVNTPPASTVTTAVVMTLFSGMVDGAIASVDLCNLTCQHVKICEKSKLAQKKLSFRQRHTLKVHLVSIENPARQRYMHSMR